MLFSCNTIKIGLIWFWLCVRENLFMSILTINPAWIAVLRGYLQQRRPSWWNQVNQVRTPWQSWVTDTRTYCVHLLVFFVLPWLLLLHSSARKENLRFMQTCIIIRAAQIIYTYYLDIPSGECRFARLWLWLAAKVARPLRPYPPPYSLVATFFFSFFL